VIISKSSQERYEKGDQVMPDNSNGTKSKYEREELRKLCNAQERLLHKIAEQRGLEVLAQFEADMATTYRPDDHALWQELMDEASERVKEWDKQLALDCERRGIQASLRPTIHVNWYGRGGNALKERVAELRRVAQSANAVKVAGAKVEISLRLNDYKVDLVSSALTSDEARKALAEMPKPETLIPALSLGDVEAQADKQRQLNPGFRRR
jgi:hypothetical protein